MLATQAHQGAHDEVRKLVALAETRTNASRQDLYDSIAELFERRGDHLSDAERAIILEILERLSHEVEMSVRLALANRLAERGDAPRELVRMLANDDLQVAQNILAGSPVLLDEDLIDIVRHRTKQHQLAVAIRKDISEDVSAALVETGNEDVIVTLLNNHDARVSSTVLEYLAEESRRVDAYQKPLVRRPDLPNEVAARMCAWVSDAIRSYIVSHYQIDPSSLDEELAGAVSNVLTAEKEKNDAAAKLVDQLHTSGELNYEFVTKALQQGQIALFEFAMARLLDVEPTVACRIIYQTEGEDLAKACRAVSIPRSSFLMMFQLTRKAGATKARLTRDETVRLCRLYDTTSPEAAALVLKRWQRERHDGADTRTAAIGH